MSEEEKKSYHTFRNEIKASNSCFLVNTLYRKGIVLNECAFNHLQVKGQVQVTFGSSSIYIGSNLDGSHIKSPIYLDDNSYYIFDYKLIKFIEYFYSFSFDSIEKIIQIPFKTEFYLGKPVIVLEIKNLK
ncbi:hypothetical protein PNU17_12250 [Turicibacter sanguinis]|uniref:hypothetical protein n=1 Tax=Turicibacter sanguinis TaxID=154288 RepID=UPI00189B0BCE|nr:hypothetical protein [Turicibacter sanguinis]MDB8556539.1 hypothetical protein [Turicibacter sanguinis]